MKQAVLKLIGRPWRAGVRWYLSKPRDYRYKDTTIQVTPGVFHPGFFFSTRFILEFIETQQLSGKKFLELGSGSGLISVVAAKKGAVVTASDINTKAVSATRNNAISNQVTITTVHSDLFDGIPSTRFDWIVINPPYYPSNPKTEEEHAWYCGKEHEYFERLFRSLNAYLHDQSSVLIILSDVCDIRRITSIAEKNLLALEKIAERSAWADGKNYLYWIKAMR